MPTTDNQQPTTKPDSLELNGKTFYYEEIANYSFRTSIPINGYEAKVLEFCRNWLTGQQEFVVHTSGSTGTPKDITLTRVQLEGSAKRTVKKLGLKKADRVLVCLNVEAVSGMMMLVRGFVADLHLTIIEPIGNPLAFSKPEKPFDFISLVPYQLHTIISETPAKKMVLDFAKAILVGGAPVSAGLEKDSQTIKAAVYQTYGMTETASHVALRRINGKDPEKYYKVLEGVILGQDDRGCLTIKDTETQTGLIVTNDLVQIINPDTFLWHGRADNTINSGGYKIQLEKIEVLLAQVLLNQDRSYRSFISSLPDETLGSKLVAVLEGTSNSTEEEENNIKKELAHFLPVYERPKAYYYVPEFITTTSGKIDKLKTLALITASENKSGAKNKQ